MDPNETLRQLRDVLGFGAHVINFDEAKRVIDAVSENFEALDEWLSKGGFLPTDWER